MEEESKPRIICDLIVPTYNKLELTQDFVKSLQAETTLPARVIFVDNGSKDGTREYLTGLKDTDTLHFTVVLNNENGGYVGGMNQGLQMSDAPYVCFSNNDLIFSKNWLEEIITTFKEHPDVGVLNPNSNTLNAKPDKGESVESFVDVLHRLHTRGSMVEMPFCIGFCMVVRRAVIDKIGGFAKEFAPMFYEDSDYSRRARQAGFRLGFARRAYVFHHEHGSLGQLNDKEALFAKSRTTYLNKWGRTLRIAWIVNSPEALFNNLDKALEIGRDANYIWFWVRGLNRPREEIFREAKRPEFADIKFIPFTGMVSLLWRTLTKKKKYDLIIAPDKKVLNWLKLFSLPVYPTANPEVIREFKFKDLDKA